MCVRVATALERGSCAVHVGDVGVAAAKSCGKVAAVPPRRLDGGAHAVTHLPQFARQTEPQFRRVHVSKPFQSCHVNRACRE